MAVRLGWYPIAFLRSGVCKLAEFSFRSPSCIMRKAIDLQSEVNNVKAIALYARGHGNIDLELFRHVSVACKQLSYLDLSVCNIDNKTVKSLTSILAEEHSPISHIKINYNSSINPDCIEYFNQLSYLRKLDLRKCCRINEYAVNKIVGSSSFKIRVGEWPNVHDGY